MSLLHAESIACGYGGRPILSNVTFSLGKGESLSIVGPNGSGKSTLLRTLCGTLPPVEGTIQLGGQELTTLSASQRARTITMLIQIQPLDPSATVEELVRLGRTPYLGRFGHLGPSDKDAVEEALAICRLSEFRDRRLGMLSGGERQRARLAMVMAQDTPIVLLDEPTNHLDLRNRYALYNILQDVRRTKGKAVVLVSHSISDACRFSDRVLLCDEGITTGFDADRYDTLRSRIEQDSGVPLDWIY